MGGAAYAPASLPPAPPDPREAVVRRAMEAVLAAARRRVERELDAAMRRSLQIVTMVAEGDWAGIDAAVAALRAEVEMSPAEERAVRALLRLRAEGGADG